MTAAAETWRVYNRPADCPKCFVARRFEGGRETGEMMACAALDPIEKELAKRGLSPLPRAADAANVVASWAKAEGLISAEKPGN